MGPSLEALLYQHTAQENTQEDYVSDDHRAAKYTTEDL